LAPKYYILTSHHFEKAGAKPTINKEFKIPNVAGTSVDSAAYSLPTFHITIPHIITKLEDKIRFPRAYF
jgi:hypothetical protein